MSFPKRKPGASPVVNSVSTREFGSGEGGKNETEENETESVVQGVCSERGGKKGTLSFLRKYLLPPSLSLESYFEYRTGSEIIRASIFGWEGGRRLRCGVGVAVVPSSSPLAFGYDI
eukprot:301238-Amorphochlora_amoeboformis.AAC.1